MSALADLVVLGFYFVIFFSNLTITSLQILHPAKDEPLYAIALKTLFRIGLGLLFYFPVVYVCGRLVGWQLLQRSEYRRQLILNRVESEEKKRASAITPGEVADQKDKTNGWSENENSGPGHPAAWKGVIGFFHPFW